MHFWALKDGPAGRLEIVIDVPVMQAALWDSTMHERTHWLSGKRNKRTKLEEINMPVETEQQNMTEMLDEPQVQVLVKNGWRISIERQMPASRMTSPTSNRLDAIYLDAGQP